jgi:outer membrane protein
MKNLLIAFTLVFSTQAFALKMGKVDVQKVLVSIKESGKIRDKLKKEFEKKQKEIRKEEEQLVKDRTAFEKQSAIMNAKTKAKKQQELQAKFIGLQQKMQRYQGEMQKMEQKFKQPILNKIRKVVEEVSKKKGFDFTYESGTTPLLYVKSVTDITPEVIKAYDKKNK